MVSLTCSLVKKLPGTESLKWEEMVACDLRVRRRGNGGGKWVVHIISVPHFPSSCAKGLAR
jgi:hypothetical protein